MKTTNVYKTIKSPVGPLTLIASDEHLLAILWENDRTRKTPRVKITADKKIIDHPIIAKTESQLQEYFAGARTEFDLPIKFAGTTFQNQVWKGLTKIPFGKTLSYKQLAKKIGNENAVRAVGTANGKNPLSIVVPCHRVIAADGSLAGFAGGLDTKSYLIELERR